jgi:hypothetical protein
MHQQWINHGLLVRLWDCTCTRNIKMWASHIQCTIFTHCQGLTPTRNKWTMMNNDEQWWNMMKHDGQGWTSYSKLPRNIKKYAPYAGQGCLVSCWSCGDSMTELAPCEASATRTTISFCPSFCPNWQQCQIRGGIPLSRNTLTHDPWFLSTNTQWLIAIPGIETYPNQKGKGAYPQRNNLKMILRGDVRKSVTPTV